MPRMWSCSAITKRKGIEGNYKEDRKLNKKKQDSVQLDRVSFSVFSKGKVSPYTKPLSFRTESVPNLEKKVRKAPHVAEIQLLLFLPEEV